MKLLLQHKVFIGYFLLMVIIVSMVATLLHERNRVLGIETETQVIHEIQHNGNTIHRHITILATYGETALAWNEEDYTTYRSLRLRVDSMMLAMQRGNEEFVSREQIDTLRHLLVSKEEHLYRIMQLFRSQEETDSLLLNHLPVVAQQATQPRTVTRKKKGIAGWFGAKETVQLPPNTTRLNTLNEELVSLQSERQRSIDIYTDSLRLHNRELNRKLRTLITSLDEQTSEAFQAKKNR